MYPWSEGEEFQYTFDGEENGECHVEVAKCVRVDLIPAISVVV